MIRKVRRFLAALLCVAAVISLFHSTSSFAQAITLSPEQQRLLNQLPASQRDAAMRQLQQFSQQNSRVSTPESQTADAQQLLTGGVEEPELALNSPPVFSAGATAIINAIPNDTAANGAEQETVDELVENLHKRNPYKLDNDGHLNLPGIDPISLGGLSEQQASLRVSADPALRGLEVTVTLLPLSKVGIEALEPYGYELFERRRGVTSESYGVPVPADYIVGPGDSLRIQLFGNRNAEYELAVERDGSIRFPEIGPMQVGGMSFGQLREHVRTRVGEQLIGTQASVTMGELRMIQVFLVGDVNAPGSYTVGSLSTMTDVLYAGGGVARNGSLRRIELKRNGRVVSTLDVYDLLLRGDTSDDGRVQSGDVVFVPPVGKRIGVAGELKRPGIYEYHGAANVADIINLAGGLLPSALADEVKIERVDPALGLQTINAGLDSPSGPKLKVRDGDTLRVPAGTRDLDATVSLVGNVQRPGSYQWRQGLRLSELIPSSRYLEPGSDLQYVMIRREPLPNVGPQVLSADLAAAWQMRGSIIDLELQPRDTVYVFDLQTGRQQYIARLIEELKLRSSVDDPLPVVEIGGSINSPGKYPLEPGMRVADLARAGGGLSQSAYHDQAELTRYSVGADGRRNTVVIAVELSQALKGDENANFALEPFDYLSVRETPNWRDSEYVDIVGEVEFPGRYPIRSGESLASVVSRAGGLTEQAFPAGTVFTRESLKQRERDQIDVLANRMESDLAALTLSDPGQSEAYGIGRTLLAQLRNSEPVGRMVISLDELLKNSTDALILRHGDTLYVPQVQQEVTVIGEVQYATSHFYAPELSRDDYLQMSGGATNKADNKQIYVVRASGEVLTEKRSRFFSRSSTARIQPGDTIVVPLNTDRIRPLTLWTSVSQIVYNVAIAATAVSRF